MSVITTADEKLKSAKSSIRSALNDLTEIVVNDCWGADEYTSRYRERLRQSLADLLVIKERLGK